MIKLLNKIHLPILLGIFYVCILVFIFKLNFLIHVPIITFVLGSEIIISTICKNREEHKRKGEEYDKETYVATIIHDLKNPIIGQIRILETLIRKNGASNDILKELLCSNKFMLEMTMSVLNTYKYFNGKINYKFEQCNLKDLTKEACKEIIQFTEEEKSLVIKDDNSTKIIFADKMHLKRVILNLVANAIQNKKENTNIVVEISSKNDNCKFSVTNIGYHINTQMQRKLFDKYYSKSAKFNKTSTGLGLYLSKSIVNDHNGDLYMNSSIDGINTFGFEIPKFSTEKSENNIQQDNLLHQKDVSKISKLYQA